jgi:eukaryotic translation initiation factor 2C
VLSRWVLSLGWPLLACYFTIRSIQGTTRVPKYSLLYDDNKLSLDQLENITYRLAYGHQIVCLPVSLPAPVYIAEEYAKRGRNLYRRYM